MLLPFNRWRSETIFRDKLRNAISGRLERNWRFLLSDIVVATAAARLLKKRRRVNVLLGGQCWLFLEHYYRLGDPLVFRTNVDDDSPFVRNHRCLVPIRKQQ
jgi:hypothetical protein